MIRCSLSLLRFAILSANIVVVCLTLFSYCVFILFFIFYFHFAFLIEAHVYEDDNDDNVNDDGSYQRSSLSVYFLMATINVFSRYETRTRDAS